jgi:uncharacterized membrane protein
VTLLLSLPYPCTEGDNQYTSTQPPWSTYTLYCSLSLHGSIACLILQSTMITTQHSKIWKKVFNHVLMHTVEGGGRYWRGGCWYCLECDQSWLVRPARSGMEYLRSTHYYSKCAIIISFIHSRIWRIPYHLTKISPLSYTHSIIIPQPCQNLLHYHLLTFISDPHRLIRHQLHNLPKH